MSERIAVLCPTRGRKEHFAKLIASIWLTSTEVDVLAYVDNDERRAYTTRTESFLEQPELKAWPNLPRLLWSFGPRSGPVAAANHLARSFPGYAAYGFVPDDAVFTTLGWDRALLAAMAAFPRGVGLVDVPNGGEAKDGGTWWVDTPFVTRAWIEAVGFFAPPPLYHWCWPTALGALGKATHLHRMPADQMNLRHARIEPQNRERERTDEAAFHIWMSHAFPGAVDRLREAAS